MSVHSLGVGFLLMSAALNIFLYHDAAVSEHGAGHVGEEGPRVGCRLIGFHVAQGRSLTANNASSCINLAVEYHSTVRENEERLSHWISTWDLEIDSRHPVLSQAASPLLQKSWGVLLLFFSL